MGIVPLNSFRDIEAEWEELLSFSPVNNLFITPQWQETWWETQGNGKSMAGFYMRDPEGIMAIASLARHGDVVSLLGNEDTFDYNDFVIRPGFESTFFATLLEYLKEQRVSTLELPSLMETSPTLVFLPKLARLQGYEVAISEENVVPGLPLPSLWEEYLSGLSRKDRHELRRKLRRLESQENRQLYCLTDPEQVSDRFDDFLTLMRQSQGDKSDYMTPDRERFFYLMAQRTAQLGFLRLFFLEMEGKPVATCICFDYGSTRLLYNSGFNPDYGYYSVGLILIAYCLRDSIEKGLSYFDFLRGSEEYKYHLGGQKHTLYRVVVKLG
jgi:CelD/BcsL family acetyltransferase involved in cellulose biosynthesis